MVEFCSTNRWILTNSDLFQQMSTGCLDIFLTELEIKSQLFPDTQTLVWLGKSGGNGYIWERHQFPSSWCNVAENHLDSKQRPCIMSLVVRGLVNPRSRRVVPPLSPGALWSAR